MDLMSSAAPYFPPGSARQIVDHFMPFFDDTNQASAFEALVLFSSLLPTEELYKDPSMGDWEAWVDQVRTRRLKASLDQVRT